MAIDCWRDTMIHTALPTPGTKTEVDRASAMSYYGLPEASAFRRLNP